MTIDLMIFVTLADTLWSAKQEFAQGRAYHPTIHPSIANTCNVITNMDDLVRLPDVPRSTLLKDCGELLRFLWVHGRVFDRPPEDILRSSELNVKFESWFDWELAQPCTHVVHGTSGRVTSTWLRVELKGMSGPSTATNGWSKPMVPWYTLHGFQGQALRLVQAACVVDCEGVFSSFYLASR